MKSKSPLPRAPLSGFAQPRVPATVVQLKRPRLRCLPARATVRLETPKWLAKPKGLCRKGGPPELLHDRSVILATTPYLQAAEEPAQPQAPASPEPSPLGVLLAGSSLAPSSKGPPPLLMAVLGLGQILHMQDAAQVTLSLMHVPPATTLPSTISDCRVARIVKMPEMCVG